ncbi:xanthine dehydrogenase small subunit [Acidisoma cellulosilytica]|uniref:Xanthine dehydrogenase small subunit n=1 Tax=Acidisoma cellulosilyticum TaxID=2802395 RepID=A0A963YYH0_9PROT|nr:xanthine dehydrogenase small subunit [Acidisoma cellulosilyticum]MCB8879129.1 xanthine dehydrogenase small subunit [Acidisoma cellulosilyticum]
MRTGIRFLLGTETRNLSDVDPTRTVLDYLRDDESLCGTKEGCAEGDCGACTVMLADRDGAGGIRYRPVNSCIMFLPALDGKQLVTIEHLRGPGGALHDVQKAMMDHHAAQCGFCTPGFVMSLATLHRAGVAVDRTEIADALAGNLCRCTGYRPIYDAARSVLAVPRDKTDRAAETSALAAKLDMLDTESESLDMTGAGRRFIAPRSLGELTALLAVHPDALILGGGTDIGLWVTKQRRHLPLLIATEQVPELRRIESSETQLSIGAAVPYADAMASLAALHPATATLLRRIGSRQIRERGTIGGNIANGSPIGDMPPLLIAMGAVLVIASATGERRLAVEAFFLGYRQTALQPGEVLARIEIPKPSPDIHLGIYKVSKRFDQDISAVCAGFALELDNGLVRSMRIGYGGMAATPVRALDVETKLIGAVWGLAIVETAMDAIDQAFTPLSDMRASAQYRRMIARNLLLKFYLEHPAKGETAIRLRLDQPESLTA